jgi:hypothetical protein
MIIMMMMSRLNRSLDEEVLKRTFIHSVFTQTLQFFIFFVASNSFIFAQLCVKVLTVLSTTVLLIHLQRNNICPHLPCRTVWLMHYILQHVFIVLSYRCFVAFRNVRFVHWFALFMTCLVNAFQSLSKLRHFN